MATKTVVFLTDQKTAATSLGIIDTSHHPPESYSTNEVEVIPPIYPISHQPTEASLYVTPTCNLSCSYCYITPFIQEAKTPRDTPKLLTTEQWISIIHELYKNGVRYMKFIGGEPLLRSDLSTLIREADQLGVVGIEIATNATYSVISKKQDALDTYQRVKAKTLFSTSLDSVGASYNDSIRGGCDDVKRGISYLVERGFAVSVATVITKNNIDAIEDLFSFALESGVSVYQFGTLVPMFKEQKELVILDPHLLLEVCEKIASLQKQAGHRMTIVNRMVPGPNLKPHIYRMYQDVPYISESSLSGCPAGTREVYVLPDGRIVACPMFIQKPEWYSSESLINTPFSKLWMEDRGITEFRSMVATPDLHGDCCSCEFGKSCKGGCRAMTYFNRDSFEEKDPRCLF